MKTSDRVAIAKLNKRVEQLELEANGYHTILEHMIQQNIARSRAINAHTIILNELAKKN